MASSVVQTGRSEPEPMKSALSEARWETATTCWLTSSSAALRAIAPASAGGTGDEHGEHAVLRCPGPSRHATA